MGKLKTEDWLQLAGAANRSVIRLRAALAILDQFVPLRVNSPYTAVVNNADMAVVRSAILDSIQDLRLTVKGR